MRDILYSIVQSVLALPFLATGDRPPREGVGGGSAFGPQGGASREISGT